MPIEIADALAKAPSGSVTPDAAPPAPPKEPGMDIEAFIAKQPKAPSVVDRAKRLAAPLYSAAKWEGKGLHAGLTLGIQEVNSSLEELKKTINDPHAEEMPLHGLRAAWDAMGALWSPVSSALDVAVTKPLQRAEQKIGDLLKKYAAEDVYDAEARREGQRGQQYPKGVDWKIHKADIQRTIEDIQEQTSAAVQAIPTLFGAKEKAPPTGRSTSTARLALQDAKAAIQPAEPKLTPISVSLDKTMGFEKVNELIGKQFHNFPVGMTLPSGSVLDMMLPHAEGYAKSFLEKLKEHIDPKIPVKFGKQAGLFSDTAGVYIPAYHRIEIKQGEPEIVHTTVHELVHGATVNLIDSTIADELKNASQKLGRSLTGTEEISIVNNPSSPVIKELDKIIKEARVRAQKAGRWFYGIDPTRGNAPPETVSEMALHRMSPRYEFVAEVFSNPEFQEFLANSEKYASASYKFKNMLNQFGLMIGKHLGLDKPHEMQLLNQSMKVGMQLIKLQSETKPPTNRSIAEIVARTRDGETITRGDMRTATGEIARLIDRRNMQETKNSLKISVEQLIRTFNPEALGEKAKLAAATISSRIVENLQKTSVWQHGSHVRLKFWRARPDLTTEFIDKFEKGENFSDLVLKGIADRYRSWGQKIAASDKALGIDYEPRDNYLAHIFDDEEGVKDYFTRKYGSKWGDPGFIKDRAFDLYKEAVAAGFRPRFDNPEDIMLARQHASDIAAMHIGILNDLASFGLATRQIKSSERIVKDIDAEGKVQFRVEKTEGNKQPANTVRWRSPNGDVFWVDSQAHAILENAFKSKSLWADKGGIGLGFRGLMAAKNALIPVRLALSLFHPLHVTGIDMAANLSRATVGMLSGTVNPVQWLGQALTSGLSSIAELPGVRSAVHAPGWRVMRAWRGEIPASELTADDAHALQTLIEMGVAPEMSSQYRTNARQNFLNALTDMQASFRLGRIGGAAGDATRATFHLPWAIISAMGKPIFEQWIPQLKAASAIKDAKSLLERNPELAENDAARLIAMRKLGKSVENRYGEMNYSTLFWKRWMKDIAVLDTLSLGWQLGFIREYGGGAMDLGQWAKSGDKVQRIRQGQLDRPIFVGAYTALGAGVAGMMTWAMTGEQPSSLLDYISPRTGETNPDGTPQRVNTMFYSREFASLYKHIQNEGFVPGISKLVLNKGSGLFGLIHEWASGVNGYEQKIRDPSGDAFQKISQTLAYTLSDLEPISMKAIQTNITEKPVKAGVLSVLGFTPAPKYLTESKTTADIKMAFRNYVAPAETPFEKAEYSKEYSQLRDAYQTGSEKYGDLLDQIVERYELSGTDQRRLLRSLNSTIPPTTRMFMRLPWQEQKKILDRATPEEVDELLPHSNREHIRNVWTSPQ